MPRSQKAEVRPISFTLNSGGNFSSGNLLIRPEDLTRTEPSRLSVTQTFGGAWADNFGRGVGTLTISGHTGWGQGNRFSGFDEFQSLYARVYQGWHAAGGQAELVFADALDEFVWIVAPQVFTLKRNRQRPLLMMYNIVLTWLADG